MEGYKAFIYGTNSSQLIYHVLLFILNIIIIYFHVLLVTYYRNGFRYFISRNVNLHKRQTSARRPYLFA